MSRKRDEGRLLKFSAYLGCGRKNTEKYSLLKIVRRKCRRNS